MYRRRNASSDSLSAISSSKTRISIDPLLKAVPSHINIETKEENFLLFSKSMYIFLKGKIQLNQELK